MKITKQQLKQIIKEELESILAEKIQMGTPGLRGKVKDFLPKSMAHAVGNVSKGLAGNDKYTAAWKAIGKELNSGNIETFIRAVKSENREEHIEKLKKSMKNNKLKAVYSLKDVVSLMGSEGKRRGHAIGSDRDPGYVRENTKE